MAIKIDVIANVKPNLAALEAPSADEVAASIESFTSARTAKAIAEHLLQNYFIIPLVKDE